LSSKYYRKGIISTHTFVSQSNLYGSNMLFHPYIRRTFELAVAENLEGAVMAKEAVGYMLGRNKRQFHF
jgi:hypothetical protein